jgi:hypothetical protein
MKRRNNTIIAAIILIVILIIAKCNCRTQTKIAERFVNPPIPTADIPFTDYTVDAAKGDTIMYPSGSVLLFPKEAFVDKNGKVVEGKVNIKYREFSNPADQFLSGIPMGYDSAGVHYTFESAGMCDIQAFKDGQPVFVNKKNKPVINIATQNTDPAQNLYYLDTVTKQWVNRGKSEILEVGKEDIANTSTAPEVVNLPKPVKPSLMNNEKPIIKVTIDPESFEELKAYNNLQFQVDKSEKRFNPEASNTVWSDIRLKKGKKNGIYFIKFTGTNIDKNRSVEYKVRPVLSDKDYAKAMVVYNRQISAYEKKIDARLASYKANRETYLKDSIKNSVIDKENEKTAQLNKIIEAKNAEIEAQNIIVDAQYGQISNNNLNRIVRNFQIERLGIWNTDKPFNTPTSSTLQTFYVNTNKDQIQMHSVNLLIKDINCYISERLDKISVPINMNCMIIGASEGRFTYITFDEFKNLNITPATKTQTIPMHVVSQENNNYAFIKSIIK